MFVSGLGTATPPRRYTKAQCWSAFEQSEWFQRLDTLLKNAGRAAYDAAQSLCLDFYWFPDDDPAWLARLIEARLGGVGAGQSGAPADAARIGDALEGLLALAEGMGGRGRVAAPPIRA